MAKRPASSSLRLLADLRAGVSVPLCGAVRGALSAGLSAGLSAALWGALSSCALTAGNPSPTTQPVFPTGLAVHPDGNHLVVVSSNFDLAYDNGGVFLADLAAVRSALATAEAAGTAAAERVVDGAYVAQVPLPAFGDKPVFDATGAHLLLSLRGINVVADVNVDVATPSLSCAGTCGDAPGALQLAGNDPFHVLPLSQSVVDGGLTGLRGVVSLLGAPELTFFTFDPAATDATRLRVEAATDPLVDGASGVRAIALQPASGTHDAIVHAAVEVKVTSTTGTAGTTTTGVTGLRLVSFEIPAAGAAASGTGVVRRVTDVTTTLGAFSARDLLFVPAHDGQPAGLLVALRSPDAIARFDVDDDGALHLAGVEETCQSPTGLALAHIRADASAPTTTRALLTCPDGQSVLAVDPTSLDVTDAVRFLGRAPYDVVVNDAITPPEAYVSFFLDNSVGVLSLVDANGHAKVAARGRIGTPLPTPEDGRE